MTPEQRLDRVERILGRMATAGRKAREEFREKINILIDTQIRSDDEFREKIKILTDAQNKTEELTCENSKAIKAVNEQLQAVAVAQAELTQSQKLTDRALRDYLNSLRRRKNGNSSNQATKRHRRHIRDGLLLCTSLWLNIKPEMNDITFLHDVVSSFQP